VGGIANQRHTYLRQRSYTVRPSVASLFSAASLDFNGPWDKAHNTRAFVHYGDHNLLL
jgi:hypothetical protein